MENEMGYEFYSLTFLIIEEARQYANFFDRLAIMHMIGPIENDDNQ